MLRPEKTKSSPLDVSGLKLRLTRKEIVEFVRTGRRSARKTPRPTS